MHVQVGHLSQVSTFDLFEFLSKFFFPKSKFPNLGCGLSASAAYTPVFTVPSIQVYTSRQRGLGSTVAGFKYIVVIKVVDMYISCLKHVDNFRTGGVIILCDKMIDLQKYLLEAIFVAFEGSLFPF